MVRACQPHRAAAQPGILRSVTDLEKAAVEWGQARRACLRSKHLDATEYNRLAAAEAALQTEVDKLKGDE